VPARLRCIPAWPVMSCTLPQVQVRELESLMTLHEVQGSVPGKHARAFPVQRSPSKADGHSNDSVPQPASSLRRAGISHDSMKQV
jgi:hypothetical protein